MLELSARERWAIEIKRSLSDPSPAKGFYFGCADIKATRQFVLYPGRERFKINTKTEVMPLDTFLAEEMPRRVAA